MEENRQSQVRLILSVRAENRNDPNFTYQDLSRFCLSSSPKFHNVWLDLGLTELLQLGCWKGRFCATNNILEAN